MKQILSITLSVLIFAGCSNKEQPVPAGPELIWSVPLTSNELASSMRPIIYKNKVIFSKDPISTSSTVMAFNKGTGEMLWEWDDFQTSSERLSPRKVYYRFENVLVLTTGGQVYAINLDTGKTIWKTWEEKHGGKSLTGIGDQVYHIQFTEDQTQHWIARANVFEGKWEKVYYIEQTDDFVPIIRPPSVFLNEEKDTCMIFTHIRYNFSTYAEKYMLTYYNLSQDSNLYDVSVDTLGSGSLGGTTVYSNQLITGVWDQLMSYDLITGDQLWSSTVFGGVGFTGHIFRDDRIFVGSEGVLPRLYALDPETGKQLWKAESAGTSSLMDYRNGIVYYTGGRQLWAVNAATGNLEWQIDAPGSLSNSDVFFDAVVTIDQEAGHLYTANYLQALCYKLKE